MMPNEIALDRAAVPLGLQEVIDRELVPGEKLLWLAQPNARRVARNALDSFFFLGVGGAALAAFLEYWVVELSAKSPPTGPSHIFAWIYLAFGAAGILRGLGMASAPLFKGRQARDTVYALTSRRAIVAQPVWPRGRSVRSIEPGNLSARTRIGYGDGSGTLVFDSLTILPPRQKTFTPGKITVSFEAIPDVAAVDDLLSRVAASQPPVLRRR